MKSLHRTSSFFEELFPVVNLFAGKRIIILSDDIQFIYRLIQNQTFWITAKSIALKCYINSAMDFCAEIDLNQKYFHSKPKT